MVSVSQVAVFAHAVESQLWMLLSSVPLVEPIVASVWLEAQELAVEEEVLEVAVVVEIDELAAEVC